MQIIYGNISISAKSNHGVGIINITHNKPIIIPDQKHICKIRQVIWLKTI